MEGKTSSILMLFLLIIHHLIPPCSLRLRSLMYDMNFSSIVADEYGYHDN